MEPGESGEVRWLLYAGANWEYSGYLQYVEEYGYVYAYNDHNAQPTAVSWMARS